MSDKRAKYLLAHKRVSRGDVAQLGEHHVRNVGVVGSNPIISTTFTAGQGGNSPWPFFFLNLLKMRPGANQVQIFFTKPCGLASNRAFFHR